MKDLELNDIQAYNFINANELVSNYDGEYWDGINNSNTLKVLISNIDGWFLCDFGITAEQLRKDEQFFYACLNDGDVNHGLDSYRVLHDDGCIFVESAPSFEEFKNVLSWFKGETDFLPVTPCGLTNYIDGYLQ